MSVLQNAIFHGVASMSKLNVGTIMTRFNKDNVYYFVKGLFKKGMKCPYCGSSPIIYDKKYLVIDICKCNSCGLFFVNPFYISNNESSKFYDDSYSSDATVIPDDNSLALMKINNFAGSQKDYNDRLKIIKKLSTDNYLLEFGSSWGYFLFQAKKYDFMPVGVEISLKRAKYGSRNLSVQIYNDIDEVEGKFNVICSFHVLEHLVDLSKLFDKFFNKLLGGGRLIIEVPNFDPETKGKSVYPIIGKVHPLGFSKNFFKHNLPKHGFSEIKIAGNYEDLLKEPEDRLPLRDVIIACASKESI